MSYAIEAVLKGMNTLSTASNGATRSTASAPPKTAEKEAGTNWSLLLIALFAPIPITILSAIIISGLMGIDFVAFKAVFPPTFLIFEALFGVALLLSIVVGSRQAGNKIDQGLFFTMFFARLVSAAFVYIQIMLTIAVLESFIPGDAIAPSMAQLGTANTMDATIFIGASSLIVPLVVRYLEPYLPAKKVEHVHRTEPSKPRT